MDSSTCWSCLFVMNILFIRKFIMQSLGAIITAHKIIRSCWLAWVRIDGNLVTLEEEILPPINLLRRV